MSLLRKKTKVEYVPVMYSKDWAHAGDEIERLGRQLDAVRDAKKRCTKRNSWAKKHWAQTEQILLRKWKQTIRLQSVGLRQAVKDNPNHKISYDWWEPSEEVAVSIPLFDNLGRMLMDQVGNTNYDRAWELAKEEKLQKARQGLA